MDEITKASFAHLFEIAFLKRKAQAFEDLFTAIMKRHFPNDFLLVKPWGNQGDQKCDGFLKSKRTLFQVYAPNEMKQAKTIRKIRDDFDGAVQHWDGRLDSWVFVHNSREGLSPEITKLLLDLGKDRGVMVETWGFEELRGRCLTLNETALTDILGAPVTIRNFTNLGVEDLTQVLEEVEMLPGTSSQDLRPPPQDKMKINSLSRSAQTLLTVGMTKSELVKKYYQRNPERCDALAETFRSKYESLRDNGKSADVIFRELQTAIGGEVVLSPQRTAAVYAVLAYLFEECNIFERGNEQ